MKEVEIVDSMGFFMRLPCYPTAAALADDLDRWLRGEDVSVTTAATAPLLTLAPAETEVKPPRRRRVVLAVAGIIALAALATGLFGALREPPKNLRRAGPRRREGKTDRRQGPDAGRPTQRAGTRTPHDRNGRVPRVHGKRPRHRELQ